VSEVGAAVRIPDRWYNVTADFPDLRDPYVDPATGRPLEASVLEELFAPELVAQEFDARNAYLPIPEEVLRRYSAWRPTPLVRARTLEQRIDTRCRILYKYEGASPIGSHKANSGVAQAYYSQRAGRTRVYAETGAGQWGSAISMGACFVGVECDVFMVANSYDVKPARRVLMETFGATVHRSPTSLTEAGRAERAAKPDSQGNLGLAIAESVEAASADSSAAYALGSAFGFVCLHQTIIGQELKEQLRSAGCTPDVLISCIGGGSSFAGLVFPFLEDVRRGASIDLVAVESNAVPKVTRGQFAYDHGDTAGLTPLMKMYTLGHSFLPPAIHSGGLRYHGLASQVSKLISSGQASAVAVSQLRTFEAAKLFAQCEGLVPAPEAAHSIVAAIDYARAHRNEEKTIVFCLTGHGFFDLSAYEKFNSGEMQDSDSPEQQIEASLAALGVGPTEARGADEKFEAWRRLHFDGAEPIRAAQPDGADLRTLELITEKVVRRTRGHGPLLVSSSAIVTPAAASEARAQGRDIQRVAAEQ